MCKLGAGHFIPIRIPGLHTNLFKKWVSHECNCQQGVTASLVCNCDFGLTGYCLDLSAFQALLSLEFFTKAREKTSRSLPVRLLQFIKIQFLIPTPNQKIKCNQCLKTIAKNHRKLHCITCLSYIHMKCSNTDVKSYNKIIKDNLPQYCLQCHPNPSPPPKPKIKCVFCTKTIASNHKFLNCSSCKSQIHIKCNRTDPNMYAKIVKEGSPTLCINCKVDTTYPSKTYLIWILMLP